MNSTTPRADCCGSTVKSSDGTQGGDKPGGPTPLFDPVCGMVVNPVTAKHRAELDRQSYYFCCAGCKAKFLADPASYLKRQVKPAPAVASAPAVSGTLYTCPMHPQIRQSGPGSCPICGMALESAGIPEAEGTSSELKDMTRRLVIGALLATPIFVLEMGGHCLIL